MQIIIIKLIEHFGVVYRYHWASVHLKFAMVDSFLVNSREEHWIHLN